MSPFKKKEAVTGSESRAGGSTKNCMTILTSTFPLGGRATREIFLPVMLNAVIALLVIISLHLR